MHRIPITSPNQTLSLLSPEPARSHLPGLPGPIHPRQGAPEAIQMVLPPHLASRPNHSLCPHACPPYTNCQEHFVTVNTAGSTAPPGRHTSLWEPSSCSRLSGVGRWTPIHFSSVEFGMGTGGQRDCRDHRARGRTTAESLLHVLTLSCSHVAPVRFFPSSPMTNLLLLSSKCIQRTAQSCSCPGAGHRGLSPRFLHNSL